MAGEYHHLLQSQRNQLLQRVVEAGFHPSEFRWEDRDGGWSGWTDSEVPSLVQVKTGFFASFAMAPENPRLARGLTYHSGRHLLLLHPGDETPETFWGAISWDEALGAFQSWLRNVRRETEQPDLWAAASDAGGLSSLVPVSDPTGFFTKSEQNKVRDSLLDVLTAVSAATLLSNIQFDALKERIDYLIDSSGRLSKKDWINNALGALFGFAVAQALTADSAKALFQIVGSALHWIAGLPAQLPHP